MAYPWTAHDILTAADLNAAIAATFPAGAAGTTWTPTWTQSATITKTVSYATYFKTYRQVMGRFYMIATGAGTANNPIIVGLPLAASFGAGVVGTGAIFDASTSTFYSGSLELASTTTAKLILSGGTTYAGQTGSAFALALASSDVLEGEFQYLATS